MVRIVCSIIFAVSIIFSVSAEQETTWNDISKAEKSDDPPQAQEIDKSKSRIASSVRKSSSLPPLSKSRVRQKVADFF